MVTARTRRRALLTSGLVATMFGLVGVAHTPLGRPILGWLSGVPGCPIGAPLDAEAAAAVRAQLTAPLHAPPQADPLGPARAVQR